ncbi:MAG TPA: ROK family transcriptional regulator, partial [Acidimicrobiia bacterium]|nr:ROK family transcriptional regulator [Acidimicrobiia bacterium]
MNFHGLALMEPTKHHKATKHDSRRTNLSNTLDLVSIQGSTSRAEISRLTGLTRAAVSSLIGELIDEGLVRELGRGISAGGKPPTMVALNERGRDIVVLDLGRRPFQAALVDLSGHIRDRVEAPTPDLTQSEAVEATLALITELLAMAQAPVLGIGIGTPGVVDQAGLVVEAANLGWHNLDLGAAIRNTFSLPVSIANDAQLAALAEARRHAGRDNVLVVKLGRGVGAGVVLGARLHRGENSAAGEIGHIKVVADGLPCSCGNSGCLETVASVPAILRSVGADPDRHPWDAIALAAIAGEEPLRRALGKAGRYLGSVLAHAVALLDITHIVIAPEIRNCGDQLVDEIRAELAARVLPATAGLV